MFINNKGLLFNMIENKEFGLDLKDRKILFELEQNSRQSLNQLAKKVRLSKETAFHRIKSLEKRGIIKKYILEVDSYKLGYQFYPILIKFQNTTPAKEKEIYDYLAKDKNVAWLTKCEGSWDINLTAIAKDNFELNNFLEAFLSKYSQYIMNKEIFFSTELHYFKRGFFLNKLSGKTITTGNKKDKKLKIDDLDIKIINLLSNDARNSLVEIADKLKISAKTVAARIRKLEKKKIILGSRILVSFSDLNYKFYKIWFSLKNITKENYDKLMNHLKTDLNIIWATKLVGKYDLSIEMEVPDAERFREIMNSIKQKFPTLIKDHETIMIFEESVVNYFPV